MIKENFYINNIPTTLWGEKSNHVFIAVHGNMSHKEDSVIEILAETAVDLGYQVLSFDLPEHGDRKSNSILSKVEPCINELKQIYSYTENRWTSKSLFACSMGAYFSLLSYPEFIFKQALFLSPVVNMDLIITNIMSWFNITEDNLRHSKTISTPIGQTLYWEYFCFVKENPITSWNIKTSILYGSDDNLCDYKTIQNFTKKYKCDLSIMPKGEHFFHTKEQLEVFHKWINSNIITL
ncbi:MAG: alpha/beta hydrolase [Clostridium sp.]